MRTFPEKLHEAQAACNSLLCVGLDPDPQKIPQHLLARFDLPQAVYHFNAAIIEATQAFASTFKPNLAFFEALGVQGWTVFKKTLETIPPDKLVIADAKRGDIGNTARKYAEAFFVQFDCDAITVAPYMGADSVLPFLGFAGKAAFVLGLTSNPGADDFEKQTIVSTNEEPKPLYLAVAQKVSQWQTEMPGTAGLVVGATQADAMRAIREETPSLPFLIPGVGTQGGDLHLAVSEGAANGGPVLINASRGILYATTGRDFAEAAALQAQKLAQQMPYQA
ncbi:MAG TPA: orotidine-5'-phosphate decarboxylase [Bacteroidetes bacterium]|nr:orotidine-5'-phosphate decarboxylase [Bacteroidota bacterium]HRR08698.1 orotidine-5'-phosphate decarboxylase [Rhodothermales bacterium]